MKQYFVAIVCFAYISNAFAGSILLEEKVESSENQTEAQRLRDARDAPKSLLGDLGENLAETVQEGTQNPAKFPFCNSNTDTCFEVVAKRDNEIDFRCSKGVGSYHPNSTRTIMLCKNGWKSAAVVLGCMGSGPSGIPDFKKAANKICTDGY